MQYSIPFIAHVRPETWKLVVVDLVGSMPMYAENAIEAEIDLDKSSVCMPVGDSALASTGGPSRSRTCMCIRSFGSICLHTKLSSQR